MQNIRQFAGKRFESFASGSFRQFLQKVEAQGKKMATNLVSLIGHGALRCGVMGYENRKATVAELDEMQNLLERDLLNGAWGLSLGLGYTPGLSSNQEELNALGHVVAKYGGIVTSHMRNQGTHTPRSLEEMYEINRKTGAHVHIAHFKVSGKTNWGRAPEFVQNVRDARQSGVNVTVDVYPYRAASSGITNSLPKWTIQGGKAMAVKRLSGPERQQIIDHLDKSFQTQADGERLLVVGTGGHFPAADGKDIWELSHELGLSMAETIAAVTLQSNAQARCISFSMSDEDVDYMLAQEDYAIGSDGRGHSLSPSENDGKPHPRNYGTFPRFLRFAREKGFCSLETAVHRITQLPAEMIGLMDRGVLKVGMVGDLTVFDAASVADKATFADPFQKPVGIEHVFLAGQPAVLHGQQTEHRLGRFLHRN